MTSSRSSRNNGYSIAPAPIARNDQRVCFICLQNDEETPRATWVNPCPCSLEAHHDCMLRWVAEMESSSGTPRDGFRCPACKALILIEEPFDSVVALHDALYRQYSEVSPYAMGALAVLGCVSASAAYGVTALRVFAGRDAAWGWLWGSPKKTVTLFKIWALSWIGPGVVAVRWFPGIMLFVMPFTTLYGLRLVASNTWPPSPRWAMVMFPIIHLSYDNFYFDTFGALERRLNRALRGLPPEEGERQVDDELPQQDAALEDAGPNQAQAPGQQPAGGGLHNAWFAGGISGVIGNIGRWCLDQVLDMAGGEIGIEVAIDGEYRVQVDAVAHMPELDDEYDDNEAGDGVPLYERARALIDRGREAQAQAPRNNNANQQRPANQQQQQPPPAQRPAAAQQQRNQQQQNPPRQQNQPQNRNNNNNNFVMDPITLISNSIISSLLYPFISYTFGELLRLLLPRRLTTPPTPSSFSFLASNSSTQSPPTLLRTRWGRSLLGGCLFVVLKDMFKLYMKYRRVQVKKKRRIKNVERKHGSGTVGASPAIASGSA